MIYRRLYGLILLHYCCAVTAQEINLLQDTDFEKGFVIGTYFIVDTNEDTGNPQYMDVAPYILKEFPGDSSRKFWKFQEGVHRNFTDQYGNFVDELLEHRFNISGQIVANTPDLLKIVLYNNYGLDQKNQLYNTRLVRYVETNKAGKVRMYFNTQNLIRNVATTHEPRFKEDTWPHFLIYQGIPAVDMAQLSEVPVQYTVRLLEYEKLSGRMAGGPVPEKANFLSYFRVKNKKTGENLWLGICMYTSSGIELYYDELMSVDQHGTGMYRFPVREYGGPLESKEAKTYEFDLKKILARALRNPQSRQGDLLPDDYVLVSFNIGWECIGDHETLVEFYDLSAKALMKQ
jgi:hypothetical protein